MTPPPVDPRRAQWIQNLFYPLVAGVMVSCVAWAVAELLDVYFDLSPTFVVLGCMLVALEAGGSYRLLRLRRDLRSESFRFRLIELTTILIALKIARYVGYSGADLQREIETWTRDPLMFFNDLQTGATFVLAMVIWLVVTTTLDDLENLNEPPERVSHYVPRPSRLSERFLWGGAILLAVIGLTQAAFANPERPAPGHPPTTEQILAALLYFLLGLVMLGQIHYTKLQGTWLTQEAQVSEKLAGRWVRYSLIFIGLAALLAVLLPTNYTLGLLNTVGLVLGLVLQFLALFLGLIMFLLQLLFWPFVALLGISESAPELAPPKLELAPAAPAGEQPGGGTDWLAILQSVLFWAVLTVVILYVVRAYLRDRPQIRQALARFRPLQWLRRGWALLKGWWRAWSRRLGQTVKERLPRGLPRRSAPGESPRALFRFFRLGGLSPRERILYYYLSVLERARQRGFPRRGHQTPHEYYDTLEPNLPQAQREMEQLTQAFVEARYSQHELDSEQDEQVRDEWKRVRAALRALKRRQNPDENS